MLGPAPWHWEQNKLEQEIINKTKAQQSLKFNQAGSHFTHLNRYNIDLNINQSFFIKTRWVFPLKPCLQTKGERWKKQKWLNKIPLSATDISQSYIT